MKKILITAAACCLTFSGVSAFFGIGVDPQTKSDLASARGVSVAELERENTSGEKELRLLNELLNIAIKQYSTRKKEFTALIEANKAVMNEEKAELDSKKKATIDTAVLKVEKKVEAARSGAEAMKELSGVAPALFEKIKKGYADLPVIKAVAKGELSSAVSKFKTSYDLLRSYGTGNAVTGISAAVGNTETVRAAVRTNTRVGR